MTETHTSGKVAQVNQWKKGKGYFVSLEETFADFYGFGTPPMNTGEEWRLTYKPGTGRLSEKYEIVKAEKLEAGAKQETITIDLPLTPTTAKKYEASRQANNIEENIKRAVALKAAVELLKGTLAPEETIDTMGAALKALEVAKKFEAYLNEH